MKMWGRGSRVAGVAVVLVAAGAVASSTGVGGAQAGGFAKYECGGGGVCISVVFNSWNPSAHDVQQIDTYMKEGLPGARVRTGYYEVFGPNGTIAKSDTRSWGPGDNWKASGFQDGGDGDLWCVRFFEGAAEIAETPCVTG